MLTVGLVWDILAQLPRRSIEILCLAMIIANSVVILAV